MVNNKDSIKYIINMMEVKLLNIVIWITLKLNNLEDKINLILWMSWKVSYKMKNFFTIVIQRLILIFIITERGLKQDL